MLVDLVAAAGRESIGYAEAAGLLRSWTVVVDAAGGRASAAVAVLPPDPGRHRGYGAWWEREARTQPRAATLVERLVRIASSLPLVNTLQVSVAADDGARTQALESQGFEAAVPVWTMRHDALSRRAATLPGPLRVVGWDEAWTSSFKRAYDVAYADQRMVEAQTPSTWVGLIRDDALVNDVSVLAVDADSRVVGFVLAFAHGSGVELGPIGTVPRWRGNGVSSALLGDALRRCRELRLDPVTLTVDGESPTGAHEIYLRHGFAVTERLVAYRRALETEAWTGVR
ncbi:GCN5-related protein N-acetyltransferase [Beutenbergia cavernae DSM 12333]|uniref:GCN5-related protein N-acetyltransferase n=2 Tax=Beutenbergia TaxID=84756 RepID=C5BXM3_BEUC1|nr:GCN5-related protein N-acetyltransferase [Beutenbergia cavernae DSM 12333]